MNDDSDFGEDLFLDGVGAMGQIPVDGEAERIEWIALDDVERLIRKGEIVGAGSVSGLLALLLLKARGKL